MAHVHDGHRARLRQRLENEGLDSFEPHEVLELLLFYTIPLRNVNPLAHALIDQFGTLPNVLRATKAQLMRVPGVGETTADWLHSIRPMLSAYGALRLDDRPKLDRLSSVTAFGERLFEREVGEQLWVINMNLSGYLLHSAMVESGKGVLERLDAARVVDYTLRYRAQAVVLLQHRLPANMRPEPLDIEFTGKLDKLLTALGVQLMDNVMISGHSRTSLRECGILKREEKPGRVNEESGMSLAERWLD